MADSWKDARECTVREGFPLVYHDCDNMVYGACRQEELQGVSRGGIFIEHRCICLPAHLNAENLKQKRRSFSR